MTGLNTGILSNAYPLTSEQILELEKQVLEKHKSCAYLDENNKFCFLVPLYPDVLKELAWNNTYELFSDATDFTKKHYKKSGLKTFFLYNTYKKQNINDNWTLITEISLLDESLLDKLILE